MRTFALKDLPRMEQKFTPSAKDIKSGLKINRTFRNIFRRIVVIIHGMNLLEMGSSLETRMQNVNVSLHHLKIKFHCSLSNGTRHYCVNKFTNIGM